MLVAQCQKFLTQGIPIIIYTHKKNKAWAGSLFHFPCMRLEVILLWFFVQRWKVDIFHGEGCWQTCPALSYSHIVHCASSILKLLIPKNSLLMKHSVKFIREPFPIPLAQITDDIVKSCNEKVFKDLKKNVFYHFVEESIIKKKNCYCYYI